MKDENSLPTEYNLSQNYPNPFNPATTIKFAIPKDGFTTLIVYDLLGRETANLISSDLPAGNYSINFDASKLSSGIYIYRLVSGSKYFVRKMILLK